MYFEDIEVGLTIELEPAVIDKDEMIEFSKRYNNIPLHTDEQYARTTPIGRLLAPGLLSFAVVWQKYIEKDIFADELIAGRSTKIEWLRPVFAGDTLCGVARISDKAERNAKNGCVTLVIDAYNGDGVQVLTSTTEAIIKRKQ